MICPQRIDCALGSVRKGSRFHYPSARVRHGARHLVVHQWSDEPLHFYTLRAASKPLLYSPGVSRINAPQRSAELIRRSGFVAIDTREGNREARSRGELKRFTRAVFIEAY